MPASSRLSPDGRAQEFSPAHRRAAVPALVALLAALLTCATGCARRQTWKLTDITGNLPDLQFSLATAGNAHLTAADFHGQIVLLYFGYVHCPDVCPMTMARLAGIVRQLGPDAPKVHIVFVSVDPKRDTPELVQTYAHAFSPAATGATGTAKEIENLARRYRVAYQAEAVDKQGGYEVMHSKAVYVFDGRGHARLLISDTDATPAIVHDLRQLAETS